MESRLPMPKVSLKKTKSNPFVNNMDQKPPTQEPLPSTSSSSSSSSSLSNDFLKPDSSKDMRKAISTNNLGGKQVKENKPPTKPLVRAKTTATITTRRSLLVAKRAVKRPAGVVGGASDAKRANTARPGQRNALQSSNNTTSRVGNATGSKVAPKPSKWDLKGRLQVATDELTSTKTKNKDLSKQCSEYKETMEELKKSEADCRKKMVEYQTSTRNLTEELKTIKVENSTLKVENDRISKELKDQVEAHQELSAHAKRLEDDSKLHTAQLSSRDSRIRELLKDLEVKMKCIEELTTQLNDLQGLIHNMDRERRMLHNSIQELKGNIRVFCRVRPRTPKELGKGTCTINFVDECTIEVAKSEDSAGNAGRVRQNKQEFTFDKVFPPNTSQADVFEELSMLVQSALEGYNVCVFAYGQTGSGKTYTMEGIPGEETEGMIPRTVRHIFAEMKHFELLGWEYKIEASFLEIYNEHIVDLLDSKLKSHEIRMVDSKGTDLYVSNLLVEEIDSPEKLHECLLIAQRNRAVAATQANERSSRSHSVARIRLIGTHKTKGEVSTGNLNLVDLAGSERLKGEEAVRTTETKNINKSLANLGNVILALLKKQDHIPYRNSKLTHLLMPSLGGNSKTLMLLNISPLDECYNETLNSLRFGSNVNSCKIGNVKRTRTVLQAQP